MGLGKSGTGEEPPEFGAAADGDADRNMILGKRWICTDMTFDLHHFHNQIKEKATFFSLNGQRNFFF